MTTAVCSICCSERWLRAEHTDQPWEHDGCGGAGAPCICNPHGDVAWREIIATNEEPGPVQ